MGKFTKEEYAFKGKVGPMHGSSMNGKPYVKGPYKKRTKPAKKGEQQNRNKFKMANLWLRPILKFVRQGFNGFNYKENSQGYNAAKSHMLLNAFEGQGPDLIINPALVKVSYGNLPLPSNISITKLDDFHLKFSWEDVVSSDRSQYDQAMLLLYDIEHGLDISLITGPFRETGEAVVKIGNTDFKSPLQGKRNFHCYLAFVAVDRSRQSDSIYLGEITF